uniref:MAGE domain-containing protein n=1 Tax=Chenopodium quinoa TaxID=63459 RepID=A0A803LUN1_CHEQI
MSTGVEDLSQFDLSDEEKDRLVAENYRLRALPAAVIDKAKEKLAGLFGYDLKELQRTRPPAKNQTRSSQNSAADMRSYIVISQLPANVYQKHVEDISTAHLTGFTFVIISVVHLAGGKISEENLWHHMRRMGLQEADENHPALGNVKLSLEVLVQQRYLQKDKVNGPEGTTVMYELAERALDGEVSQKIKEYISQAQADMLLEYVDYVISMVKRRKIGSFVMKTLLFIEFLGLVL